MKKYRRAVIVNGNPPEALRNFLRYVETKKTGDKFTRELDYEVERSRRNVGWRREYMKELLLYHDLREERVGK